LKSTGSQDHVMKNIHNRANFALSAFVGLGLLLGPALAINAVKNDGAHKVSGAGLVLMVSLQRM
jgi:hypothetical protein